jgi:hypothetical protein
VPFSYKAYTLLASGVLTTNIEHYLYTTVVDKFRELGNVYGSDGSELELDDVCAKKTNGGAMLKTKSGETVASKPIASVRRG